MQSGTGDVPCPHTYLVAGRGGLEKAQSLQRLEGTSPAQVAPHMKWTLSATVSCLGQKENLAVPAAACSGYCSVLPRRVDPVSRPWDLVTPCLSPPRLPSGGRQLPWGLPKLLPFISSLGSHQTPH